MTRSMLRGVGVALLVILYSLLAHYSHQTPARANMGMLVALAPVLLIAVLLAWHAPQRIAMLLLVGVALLVLRWQWVVLTQHVGLVYWLQYTSMQIMLFVMFARTLIGGRKPLCTHFAEIVHAPLSPKHVIYARQVTVAWSAFFAAMALTSTVLFFWAPINTWSIFVNFLTWPLVGLMFVAEYGVRRWLLPELRHTHLFDAIRAFRHASTRPR